MWIWLMAFLHHLAAFTLVAVLVCELLLLRLPLTVETARRLLRLDLVYGISAGTLLVVGLMRVFFFEKGTAYYLHSAPFFCKIALFALVGVISILPTREFLSWRLALSANRMPAVDDVKLTRLRRLIHVELALIPLILLCAALMAKGVGLFPW